MRLNLLCLFFFPLAGQRECTYNLAEVPGVHGSYVYRSFKGARSVKEAGSRRIKLVCLEIIMVEGGKSGCFKEERHPNLVAVPSLVSKPQSSR
jgi:hypothetical protein